MLQYQCILYRVHDGEISHLETEVYEAKLQLSELSDKLETEISASSNLKVHNNYNA